MFRSEKCEKKWWKKFVVAIYDKTQRVKVCGQMNKCNFIVAETRRNSSWTMKLIIRTSKAVSPISTFLLVQFIKLLPKINEISRNSFVLKRVNILLIISRISDYTSLSLKIITEDGTQSTHSLTAPNSISPCLAIKLFKIFNEFILSWVKGTPRNDIIRL